MIDYFPLKDIGATGAFEVTVLNEDLRKLVHSKTSLGHGRCESQGERDRLAGILKVVLEFLDKKYAPK